ncbi:hypothetical protein Q8791_23690 [Nocardiopsis sp. CT-R113]|uniref:Uncharacterized protein n=1 Tax=Nocardiopsis codii TaxID=3065942 RepID=A0ABU7KDB1_9ACTN|nr:hypothetical protein [Nocardiopsis sp. CT-R113]MEE2040223.1 hypothetical protein [Nocardiopsis sp. CT-R113]
MSETIAREMHDDLHTTLGLVAAAFARVDIRIGDTTHADLHADIHHWQGRVWNAVGDLADLDTGNAWSLTVGLEDVARRWVLAADAFALYRQMAAPWREGAFEDAMGPVHSGLKRLVDGERWTVRG